MPALRAYADTLSAARILLSTKMPTAVAVQPEGENKIETGKPGRISALRVRFSHFLREVLVFLTFCLFTATLTWPYVTRLRDAVVDGCEREAAGRSIDDLVAERDRGVIAVLRALGRA